MVGDTVGALDDAYMNRGVDLVECEAKRREMEKSWREERELQDRWRAEQTPRPSWRFW